MRKRLLSLLLVACMVLPLVPLTALPVFATEAETGNGVIYSTTLTPGNENWPTIDGVSLNEKGDGYDAGAWHYTNATENKPVSFHGGWDIGNRAHGNATKEGFTPYTCVTNSGGSLILRRGTVSDWWDITGGVYMEKFSYALMFSGMEYTPSKDVADDEYRTAVTANYDPSIRYTAEYTGTVTVNINDLFFNADEAVYFKVLLNGEEKASLKAVNGTYAINADTGLFEHSGAKNAASQVGNENGQFTFTVNKGDTIEFLNYGNENFRNDKDLGEEALYSKLDWKNAGAIKYAYNNSKRGAFKYSFTITYAPGYEISDIVDVWDGENSADPYYYKTYKYDNSFYFFAWYKDTDTIDEKTGKPIAKRLPYNSTASALAGAYAVVNPDLLTAGVFDRGDSYHTAMYKYREYLKDYAKLKYKGNWSMGERIGGKYGDFIYLSIIDQMNPFMINTSGNSTSFSSNRWVSEISFDRMFDSYYAAGFGGTAGTYLAENNLLTPDTAVSDIKIPYKEDLKCGTKQGTDCSYAPTNGTSAQGGAENSFFSNNHANIFYVRAGSSAPSAKDAGAFTYVAPQTVA